MTADIAAQVEGWLRALRPLITAAQRGINKADASPVTEVDIAIETALRSLIERAYPDHGIIGEELLPVRAGAPHTWYIDPLDGTKSFITGRPLYGVLLGLCKDGVPIFGAAYQPVLDRIWLGGRDYPAALHTAQTQTLKDAIIASTAPECFTASQSITFQRLAAHCRFTQWGGDWHNYMLLAEGGVDIVVEAGLKPYDILPLVPIIEAAGGVICDWDGVRLRAGQERYDVIASANASLLDAVRKNMIGNQ